MRIHIAGADVNLEDRSRRRGGSLLPERRSYCHPSTDQVLPRLKSLPAPY